MQQATASFIPDPTVGGDSDLYFLRFTATNYMVGAYPYEGFSAKFTLVLVLSQQLIFEGFVY